mmetsp:Transcript_6758/g.16423  ORF Transcript_6758/g.16423 Transcript_6758/m.16423 type:complete len:95 (+) Transcript_6758:468-752(+)
MFHARKADQKSPPSPTQGKKLHQKQNVHTTPRSSERTPSDQNAANARTEPRDGRTTGAIMVIPDLLHTKDAQHGALVDRLRLGLEVKRGDLVAG